MKTAKQKQTVITLTNNNARRIKKVCKSVKLSPEFLVNDILSRIDLVVVVKPKEYPL